MHKKHTYLRLGNTHLSPHNNTGCNNSSVLHRVASNGLYLNADKDTDIS